MKTLLVICIVLGLSQLKDTALAVKTSKPSYSSKDKLLKWTMDIQKFPWLLEFQATGRAKNGSDFSIFFRPALPFKFGDTSNQKQSSEQCEAKAKGS